MSTTRSSPASFLKHATDVASFYGFAPIKSIEKSFSKSPEKIAHLADARSAQSSFARSAGLAAVYAGLHPQEPALAFFASPSPTYAPRAIPLEDSGEFNLMVVGTNESVGEIVLIKTIAMILGEWGA
ncbi:MAG TPA: hypothetical protein VN701_01910, partial [Candidatus Paceibacterota bacterium]|nr:hypothetical protein [Candidatus Paceibacterota bacterium]